MDINFIFRVFFIGLTTLICTNCTKKYDKSKIKEAEFDQYVFENLEKYRNLCLFLERNLIELMEGIEI